jgi:hypothetical protein
MYTDSDEDGHAPGAPFLCNRPWFQPVPPLRLSPRRQCPLRPPRIRWPGPRGSSAPTGCGSAAAVRGGGRGVLVAAQVGIWFGVEANVRLRGGPRPRRNADERPVRTAFGASQAGLTPYTEDCTLASGHPSISQYCQTAQPYTYPSMVSAHITCLITPALAPALQGPTS